jgi:two-component system OmpR family sensor kinase
MIKKRLGTIRGQLVIWYLSVLGIVLLALGIFVSLTLTQYLRSSTTSSMLDSAYGELRLLGRCYITSAAKLNANAVPLASLLGSHEIAVKIVTPSGGALADHDFFDSSGQSTALHLSASTIRQLIRSAGGTAGRHAAVPGPLPSCRSIQPGSGTGRRRPGVPHGTLDQNGLILVAIPLPPGRSSAPYGYAILGRSFADANAIIRRTEVVFALGALVALLIAGLVAMPLINSALRPLRRIARTATAIAGGDLQQRANLAHSPDEIGRLGAAFDTMVDRLQAALMAAHDSEERMRRFLADASHELRTPLTVLRGMSEVLLRQGPRTGPQHDGLRDLHEESVRLSRLVDDLLTLTRLDAGQPLNPEPVPLAPFLSQFAERYSSAWPNRRIDLEVGSIDGAAAYVDPDALRRIVTNLVDNAARYSTTGTPITIGAGLPVSSGGEREGAITVAVSDRGPGLSAEDAERVFERFYRGARSRSRQSGGTGLGLAIVQALAEESGGEVTIDTAPDSGTTVTIVLPRASDSSQRA